MKPLLLLLSFCYLLSTFSFAGADEGMWLPLYIKRLNYEDMKEKGLRLSPEEIYSVNNSSIKDAVVLFGSGCTGEIISDEGLLLTNHHCGFDNIQQHSTVDHDYLKNGFWATDKSKELPNEDLSVKFLVRMENVTNAIVDQLGKNLNETEREDIIEALSDSIVNSAIEGNHYVASVESFFAGNEYYLFVYEEYKDVRFVGAPPSSIGKFGADTDNWMWPRHTGDFSLFRVYMSKDGKPAEYSPDNVPLKPKHYFPISLRGVEKDDFAFILGYPGSTERYLTSEGIRLALELNNDAIIRIRDKKLKIMKDAMDKDESINIKYASKYAEVANYWKYYKGQSKGLKRLRVYNKRKALEKEFQSWVEADKERSEMYGRTLQDIKDAYKVIIRFSLMRLYLNEAIFGSDIIPFAYEFEGLHFFLDKNNYEMFIEFQESNSDKEISKEDLGMYKQVWGQNIESQKKDVEKVLKKYFRDYYQPVDRAIFAEMLRMFVRDVPVNHQPEFIKEINSKYKGDFEKYVDNLYKKSIFPYEDKMTEFIKDPDFKTLDKDPIFEFMQMVVDAYRQMYGPGSEMYLANSKLIKANRQFIAGLREMEKNKKFYPDANSTMRLTYGTVQDYYPSDAIYFNYYTTLRGVMEKEDPDNLEFVVPDKLKELFEKKDFGRYGEDGTLHLCFITNHDITGGNSGSPVIDAEGNLIGLAFDGNWEAMSGDIEFEPDLQRTINVDIRYVLFIIDKFAEADNLIEELEIIEPAKDSTAR